MFRWNLQNPKILQLHFDRGNMVHVLANEIIGIHKPLQITYRNDFVSRIRAYYGNLQIYLL